VRQVAAARYELLCGRGAAAAELLDAALPVLPAGRKRAEALLLRVDAENADFPRLRELCAQAIVEAGDDNGLVAKARLNRGAFLFVEADAAAAVAELEAAADAARAAGLPVLSAETGAAYVARWTGNRVEVPPPVTGGSYDPFGSSFTARSSRSLLLRMEYRLDEARAELEALAQLTEEVGDEFHRAHVFAYLSAVERLAGRYERARQAAREAMLVGGGQPLVGALYDAAAADAYLGRVEEARGAALQAARLSKDTGEGLFWINTSAVLGFIELSLGNVAAATKILQPLLAPAKATGCNDPGIFEIVPNAAHALLELGEYDAARPLIEELEERGRALDSAFCLSQAARLYGLLAAAEGETEAAFDHFQVALREHERLPVPFEHARTLLALGATLRRARRKAEARETLGQALAIFEELGARLWAERTREELARISGRRAGGSELTETERQIAELVAAGRSNKEVAATLYVTVRTVESNLTRIYAKLGIRSRTELAHRLS
jgi:DNA-binding CsgD family transcriptional regulator